jgi:serine/threonine-protein phosphatase 2A regulatory subunit B'
VLPSASFVCRDYLKTITHRIYSKLTQRRALIRRVICNVFFEFVFETEKHNGVAEMLEILASIINGFAVPIKDEHKVMLVKALLPLHKSGAIGAYHPQLSYCIALYVAKDHALTRDVLPGLLRMWPFGNSQKQIMFLNELEDIFEYVQVRWQQAAGGRSSRSSIMQPPP